MRQTCIDWGDLRLWNVQTNSIDQEQVFDPSGTDVIYSRITVHVTGHIREGAATTGIRSTWVDYETDPDLPPESSAQSSGLTAAIGNFRSRVCQRNKFRMWIGCDDAGNNGTLHLFVSPYTDNTQGGVFFQHDAPSYVKEWYDADAGPKCRRFDIESNLAAHIMRVSMVFELCVPWCESADSSTKILTNRWSVSDQIDDNLLTTRTYHGTLRVANPYINPNLLRQTVLPPLAEGMRRASMSFDVGDDQRSLTYRIVDREATFAAPLPARTWNIVHSETTGIGKPLIQTNLNITLTGDRDTSKKALIQLANRIAEEKIGGLSLANQGDKSKLVRIDEMAVVDYTSSEGPVKIDYRIQATRLRDDGLNFDGAAGDIGKDLTGEGFDAYDEENPYNANVSPDPGVSGPVPFAGAVVSYLRSVCYSMDGSYTRNALPPDPETAAGAGTDPEGMPDVSVREVPAGEITVPTWVSTQFQSAIYTNYQVDAVWNTNDNRVQLPIARASAGYSSGADTCAVVRIGLPMTTRTIRIVAERLGSAPAIQTPSDYWTTGSGSSLMTYTRLSTKIAPSTPEKTPDGQDLWVMRAEYVYACSRPPMTGEDLPIGIDPSFTGPKKDVVGTAFTTFNETSTIA